MMENKKRGTAPQGAGASRRGGLALYEKHGAEHMRRIGEKGRATTRERYGLHFYSEIARRRRRDRNAARESTL